MRVSESLLSLVVGLSLFGCVEQHHARVTPPLLAPPEKRDVLHTGRLFIELEGYTADRQCDKPAGLRALCYERVQAALAGSLRDVLWPSFPQVGVRGHADELRPGDYLLLISLAIETVPPGAHGAGWSAGVRGQYRLVRDGMPVTEAEFESRSRAEFAYGRPLGVAAGEVIGGLAAHLGQVLAELPEPHQIVVQPLPAVVAKPIQVDMPDATRRAAPDSPSSRPARPSAQPAAQPVPVASR
jgi:hypothetical protein